MRPMELTRRSFLAGIGAVSVGLLFRRKLDAVLDSLEQDLIAEQQAADQLPSAAEIVVMPQMAFRPERLVVASNIAPDFIIENIQIGAQAQFIGAGISAEVFTSNAVNMDVRFDTAAPGTEIRFRVRYVGKDPRGARFQAAMIGRGADNSAMRVLPIDSGVEIVG
jgi:hypothetical protein